MLLQAYDFVELNKRFGCILQMGGSDQWGNIVNGIDLGRRVLGEELFGITSPLVTTKSGAKMGKTASGAVWLNEEMLSAYDYWQFWRNTEDQDVGRFLRLFTELDLAEIERLEKLEGKELNDAKVILANEATALCHGIDAANNASQSALQTFAGGGMGAALPSYSVDAEALSAGIEVYKLFVMSGLSESMSQAKRLIQGRGGRINNEVIESEHLLVNTSYLVDGAIKLSAGHKRHVVVYVK